MRIQIFPTGIRVEFIVLGNGLNRLKEVRAFAFSPRGECAVVDFECGIRDDQPLVKEQFHAKAVTIRAGPKGRVEREKTWLNFWNGETANGASELFRECVTLGIALGRSGFQDGDTIRQIKRSAQAVGQPCFHAFAHDDPVHDHINVMAEFLVERWWFIQLIELAVNLYPLEPLLAQFNEFFAVFAFAVTDDGGQKVCACAFFHAHDPVNHILHLLRLNRQTRRRAVGCADAGKQQPHVVIDFRYCSHGRARIFRRCFLLNRDRRAEAGNVIHIRLLHHIKELTRVGRQGFNISALAFGIDRIESKARFAGA